MVGQVGTRDDCFDAFELFSFRRVNFLDARMGMWRTQEKAYQLARCCSICAILCSSRDLINAVRSIDPGTHHFKLLISKTLIMCHFG